MIVKNENITCRLQVDPKKKYYDITITVQTDIHMIRTRGQRRVPGGYHTNHTSLSVQCTEGHPYRMIRTREQRRVSGGYVPYCRNHTSLSGLKSRHWQARGIW